jgi:hypothetical protein
VRTVIALVLNAGLDALAAVILGEYSFSGAVPWVAGIALPTTLGETAAALALS